LKDAGGNVHLTEIESSGHDCWSAAFNDYHLLDWLLSQRRGHVSPAPGSISMSNGLQDLFKEWRWWQVLAQAAVLAAILAILAVAVRRRLRAPTRY
jgi:hypothetical protein